MAVAQSRRPFQQQCFILALVLGNADLVCLVQNAGAARTRDWNGQMTDTPELTQLAERGSQRWLQILINRHPSILRDALAPALNLADGDEVRWVSPLAEDAYKEYRDGEALRRVGISQLAKRPLAAFWPPRGPVWDALGITSTGRSLFIEAKAHIAEAASPATKATEESLQQIEASLEEARRFYAPEADAKWSGTFYQYANRLAHHYLLRECNGVPSDLVFVYFLNATDIGGPSHREEWEAAVRLIHAALQLPSRLDGFGVHEVFVDVSLLTR